MTLLTVHTYGALRCADCRKNLREHDDVWLIDGRTLCPTCASQDDYNQAGL